MEFLKVAGQASAALSISSEGEEYGLTPKLLHVIFKPWLKAIQITHDKALVKRIFEKIFHPLILLPQRKLRGSEEDTEDESVQVSSASLAEVIEAWLQPLSAYLFKCASKSTLSDRCRTQVYSLRENILSVQPTPSPSPSNKKKRKKDTQTDKKQELEKQNLAVPLPNSSTPSQKKAKHTKKLKNDKPPHSGINSELETQQNGVVSDKSSKKKKVKRKPQNQEDKSQVQSQESVTEKSEFESKMGTEVTPQNDSAKNITKKKKKKKKKNQDNDLTQNDRDKKSAESMPDSNQKKKKKKKKLQNQDNNENQNQERKGGKKRLRTADWF